MIGKKIRGFHHLLNTLEEYTVTPSLMSIKGTTMYNYLVKERGRVFVFSSKLGERESHKSGLPENILKKVTERFRGYIRLTQPSDLLGLNFREIIILPLDFEEEYTKFEKANSKLLNELSKKYDCGSNTLMFAFALTDGSKNLFQWVMTNLLKHRERPMVIQHFLDLLNNHEYVARQLSKGSVTSYNGFSSLMELDTEIINLIRNKRINSVINSFNPQQKKILKDFVMNEGQMEAISKFGNLSNSKRTNFIQKVSTLENAEEILAQMQILTSTHFEWSKGSLLRYIHNNDSISCDVVYDKDNIVIAKVYSYDTIKFLARSTNWCIAKNKTYWRHYTEGHNASQYVLFNFNLEEDDEYSIIGFTVRNNNGITNAHSFTNLNLMNGGFLPKDGDAWAFSHSIHSILEDLGIPEDIYQERPRSKFDWNKESFLYEVKKYVGNDFDFIKDDEGKVVIKTKSNSILNLGEVEDMDIMEGADTYIVFADFTKPLEVDSLIIAFIKENRAIYEEFCNRIKYSFSRKPCKMSFEEVLHYYNLPFNTIKRVDDKIGCFIAFLNENNTTKVSEMLGEEDFCKQLKAYNQTFLKEIISNAVEKNIFTRHSNSLVKAFYKNGLKLVDLIGFENVSKIVLSMLYFIDENHGKNGGVNIFGKRDNLKFEKKQLHINSADCIGMFRTIEMILSVEESQELFLRICAKMSYEIYKPLVKWFDETIARKIDWSNMNDVVGDAVYQLFISIKKNHLENAARYILSNELMPQVGEFARSAFREYVETEVVTSK